MTTTLADFQSRLLSRFDYGEEPTGTGAELISKLYTWVADLASRNRGRDQNDSDGLAEDLMEEEVDGKDIYAITNVLSRVYDSDIDNYFDIILSLYSEKVSC